MENWTPEASYILGFLQGIIITLWIVISWIIARERTKKGLGPFEADKIKR